MDSLLTSTVSHLRISNTIVDGISEISWTTVGSFKCRIDLLHRDQVTQALITAEAGRAPDRQGSLFCRPRDIRAGDRIKATSGPVDGIFELESRPQQAVSHVLSHLETFIREVEDVAS